MKKRRQGNIGGGGKQSHNPGKKKKLGKEGI